MMKIRNVGAQTQKKWRPGGPPLEGTGAEGWSPEERGPKGRGPRGVEPRPRKSWGPKGGGPKGRAPQRGGSKGGGPKAGGPKISRFFSLSRLHFGSFSLSLWGSYRGNLVVFEAPGPVNIHICNSRAVV